MRIHLAVHNTNQAIYDALEADEVVSGKYKWKVIKDEGGNEIVFHKYDDTYSLPMHSGYTFVFDSGVKETIYAEHITLFGPRIQS